MNIILTSTPYPNLNALTSLSKPKPSFAMNVNDPQMLRQALGRARQEIESLKDDIEEYRLEIEENRQHVLTLQQRTWDQQANIAQLRLDLKLSQDVAVAYEERIDWLEEQILTTRPDLEEHTRITQRRSARQGQEDEAGPSRGTRSKKGAESSGGYKR